MSLSEGYLATSVATVSVSNPVVSVIIGIVLYEETLSDPAWHKLVAWIGLGLGMLGAIIISAASEAPDPESAEAVENGAPSSALAGAG